MFSKRFLVGFVLLLAITLGCAAVEEEITVDIKENVNPQPRIVAIEEVAQVNQDFEFINTKTKIDTSGSEEYSEHREVNIDREIALADDANEEESTLGGLADQFIFDPLGNILEYLKNVLQKIIIDVDDFLARIFEYLAYAINGLLETLIAIPLFLIDVVGNLLPGLIGNMIDEFEAKIDECQAKYPLDPINDTLLELEECVTDPVFHIVESLSVVITDVQKILVVLDDGVEKVEESGVLMGIFDGILVVLKGIVNGVLEILADLVAGPIADLLIAIPELIACILGDIGKNLLGQIIGLITGYVKCLAQLI